MVVGIKPTSSKSLCFPETRRHFGIGIRLLLGTAFQKILWTVPFPSYWTSGLGHLYTIGADGTIKCHFQRKLLSLQSFLWFHFIDLFRFYRFFNALNQLNYLLFFVCWISCEKLPIKSVYFLWLVTGKLLQQLGAGTGLLTTRIGP
jgi:hypothetical protein